MHILFVIKSLAIAGGGAERVLSEIVSGLVERGHRVTVASFDDADSRPFYKFNERVKLIRLGVGRIDRASSPTDVFNRIRALRRLVRDLGPSVAVGFMHSAYVPLALAQAGVPTIGSEHIVYEHYSNRPLERLTLLLASYLLTGLTAISEPMRKGFPGPIRRKMQVIPNPVGVVRAQAHIGRKNLLLTVGRLEPQKDHATLISAFAAIADKFPDWQLRIVGEGTMRGGLERQVADVGLAGRIELPGAVSKIETEYARSRLFVMPSSYESFGLATAEALASGVPAVGFADCPGTNEIIRDGVNGVLVRGPDRAQALAVGLSRLMGDRALLAEYSSRAPQTVGEYEAEGIVMRWEELLQSVVSSADARK